MSCNRLPIYEMFAWLKRSSSPYQGTNYAFAGRDREKPRVSGPRFETVTSQRGTGVMTTTLLHSDISQWTANNYHGLLHMMDIVASKSIKCKLQLHCASRGNTFISRINNWTEFRVIHNIKHATLQHFQQIHKIAGWISPLWMWRRILMPEGS